MSKVVAVILAVALLSGCDSVRLSMAEDSYGKAVEQGNLVEQLALVDELYQYAPETYQSVFYEKEYLNPLLQQLIDDPRNFKGLTDKDLQRAIAFAPQYEPFSLAIKFLADKKAVQEKVELATAEANKQKQRLKDKLSTTPKHIDTYPTNVNLSAFPRYFLTSRYVRSIVAGQANRQLNSYQLEAIVRSLAKVYQANEQRQHAEQELFDKGFVSAAKNDQQLTKENGDVQRLLAWLYKHQLAESYDKATQSNDYLQSLLNSSYGRERLDDVWIRLVEPAAKKSVMQAKKSYLNTLNLIAANIDRTAGDKARLKKVYSENLAIDKELLSLMWPPNGLDNFKESSTQARIALKQKMTQIAQL